MTALARLTSYAKTAWRTVLRDRFSTTVNVLGLALAMACCLLIGLYVVDELSYDRWPGSERVYRLVTPKGARLPPLLGPMLPQLPQVEEVVRVHAGFEPLLSWRHRHAYEKVNFVDASFPRVFDIEFVRGDPATALAGFRKMVLSEASAAKYFGSRDPVGEVLTWDGTYEYEVTGVVRARTHTHFPIHILASMVSMADEEQFSGTEQEWRASFTWSDRLTYLVLTPGADPGPVPDAVYELLGRQRGPAAQAMADGWGRFALQAVPEIHLYSRLPVELAPNGRVEYVQIAVAVSVIVMLIASINYVNLAVARGTRRTREIGIRKVVGAGRGQIVRQQLVESVLTCWLAYAVALWIAHAGLPWFNELLHKDASLSSPVVLLAGLALATSVGLLAGSYPALILSRWRPASILHKEARLGGRSALRQGLLVTQFGASAALIAGAAVVYSQLRYIESRDLGFSTERTLLITTAFPPVYQRMAALQEILRTDPGVDGTTAYWESIGQTFSSFSRLKPAGTEVASPVWMNNVGTGFIDFFGLDVVAGRGFSSAKADERRAIVLSETAARQLGFATSAEALGRELGCEGECFSPSHTVIGVVRDANFESLRRPIGPLGFVTAPPLWGVLAVRFREGHAQETLPRVHAAWERVVPDFPMMSRFLEDDVAALYEADRRLGTLLMAFAGLSASIACVGALALTLFTTQERRKEIGVRKVAGASSWHVLGLLLRDAARPVVFGSLIAWPMAWLAGNDWLQGFAYRTDVGAGPFLGATASMLAVVGLTVGYLSVRAARANPVDSLRYE